MTIIFLIFFNNYTNRKLNVDRKNYYIFDKYSYNYVLNTAKNLFFEAIKINNTNNFEYQKDNNEIKIYKINNNKYKKINNFNIIADVYTEMAILEYMKDKNIIKNKDEYYIQVENEKIREDYIGSIIEIEDYDEEYVYLTATNYFCENFDYIGNLNNEPPCKYEKNDISYSIVLNNDHFLIYSYDSLKNISK